jgi:flagellar biosynthetic protein FliP
MIRRLLFVMLLFSPGLLLAQDPLPSIEITNGISPEEGQTWSLSIQVLLAMTVLTLLPSLLLAATSFTRIVIVLAVLRQALGMPQTPPNQVLMGLALFLSFFVMSPVLTQAYENGFLPYSDGEIELSQAFERASEPLRGFRVAQTREPDLALFANLSGDDFYASIDDVSFSVLLPAFLTSELKTAFQIGFLTFIPFLIIDLVVASVLMSMGMMMLSPMLISLPFKIMLFVLVDGWSLLVGTLAASFAA